jgi:hypothetical protein
MDAGAAFPVAAGAAFPIAGDCPMPMGIRLYSQYGPEQGLGPQADWHSKLLRKLLSLPSLHPLNVN